MVLGIYLNLQETLSLLVSQRRFLYIVVIFVMYRRSFIKDYTDFFPKSVDILEPLLLFPRSSALFNYLNLSQINESLSQTTEAYFSVVVKNVVYNKKIMKNVFKAARSILSQTKY